MKSFTLNRHYFDEYGVLRNTRVTMKPFKNETLVKRRADEIKGGYVCELGNDRVAHTGSWAL